MVKRCKISELIMNNETPYYQYSEELEQYRKIRKVQIGNQTRYLTWVDDKNMISIKDSNGRELTPEELFNFVIGDNITDLARTKNIEENKADIAICLGNLALPVTRERAIKAFELYKKGIVKKIIFSGGLPKVRDDKKIMHPETIEQYMNNDEKELNWQDLPEGDWGAETFIPDIYEDNYKEHSQKISEEFLRSIGVNPEDVITETMSSSTQENALFVKNFFDMEEIETGMKIRKAIIVTTCTHGSRAMKQFQKLYGNSIELTWCPSTLDLEKYLTLKNILSVSDFDEDAFRKELKRIYCTNKELVKKLMEETANHRNAFILGDIEESEILINDKENFKEEDSFER